MGNEIFLINEVLRMPLLHIANKIRLTKFEFWSAHTSRTTIVESVWKSDIYKFLTGETDTIHEFRHNYITCSAKPKISFNWQGFAND